MTDKSKVTKFSYANPKEQPKKNARAGAEIGSKGGSPDAYERAIRKQRGAKGLSATGSIRWHHYLQFILFLGLVAYLMKSCGA
jgi:hypothetical protein